MGLSIHYSGRFNPAASLQEMVDEVADIAAIYDWPFHVYETNFPVKQFAKNYNNKIYGISFTPPDCETISLCFLSNGRMSSGVLLRYFGELSESENEEMLYTLSPKTQYAGIYIHMLIIKLFKYSSKKYFLDFVLSDEGSYWETGDEQILAKVFAAYNSFLHEITDAFQNFPMQPGENFETYFKRVLNRINKDS